MPDETLLHRPGTGGAGYPMPAPSGQGQLPTTQAPPTEPSYYDISPLKPPTWEWQIAGYFFLGGLSAGAYILARLAERFGGEEYRAITRAGTLTAFAAALPCAPLLIVDLGDPSRFHHMLRVFKPHSPMNLGAWTLLGYSGAATLAVLREWLRGDRTEAERSTAEKMVDGLLITVTDAAGIPLALLLAGYTGVLLSCTSNPLWSQNPWLGPLFSASALSSGASAIALLLEAGKQSEESSPQEAMKRIDLLGHIAEGLTMAGYLVRAGSLAQPLTAGTRAPALWGGALGLAASEVLKHLPVRGRAGSWSRMAASVLGLAGALAWRWGIVDAGHDAAKDPNLARQVSSKHPKK